MIKVNPSRKYHSYKYTWQQSPKICEAKPDKIEGEIDNLTIYHLSIIARTTQKEVTKEIHLNSIKTRPNKHLSLPNNSRIHLFLKCIWNILQDRPYLRTQNKFQ